MVTRVTGWETIKNLLEDHRESDTLLKHRFTYELQRLSRYFAVFSFLWREMIKT